MGVPTEGEASVEAIATEVKADSKIAKTTGEIIYGICDEHRFPRAITALKMKLVEEEPLVAFLITRNAIEQGFAANPHPLAQLAGPLAERNLQWGIEILEAAMERSPSHRDLFSQYSLGAVAAESMAGSDKQCLEKVFYDKLDGYLDDDPEADPPYLEAGYLALLPVLARNGSASAAVEIWKIDAERRVTQGEQWTHSPGIEASVNFLRKLDEIDERQRNRALIWLMTNEARLPFVLRNAGTELLEGAVPEVLAACSVMDDEAGYVGPHEAAALISAQFEQDQPVAGRLYRQSLEREDPQVMAKLVADRLKHSSAALQPALDTVAVDWRAATHFISRGNLEVETEVISALAHHPDRDARVAAIRCLANHAGGARARFPDRSVNIRRAEVALRLLKDSSLKPLLASDSLPSEKQLTRFIRKQARNFSRPSY